MSRLTGDGTAKPVWRHQILRRELGQRNQPFFLSADPEQRLQPHPVDLYFAKSAKHNIYIHTYSPCLLHINIVCGKREARINSSIVTP